jgi:hypothetical protein
VLILGPYQGSLSDTRARLELQKPDAPAGDGIPRIVVDSVTYAGSPPWPAAAGTGSSLQRLSPASFGNDPSNWLALPPTAGSSLPPPVLSSTTLTGGSVHLSFSTLPGLYYRVEYSTMLTAWQPLGSSIAGDGTVKTVSDSASESRRFYRVSLAPPPN